MGTDEIEVEINGSQGERNGDEMDAAKDDAPCSKWEPGTLDDDCGSKVVCLVPSDELKELEQKAAERDKFYEAMLKLKADFSNYQRRAEANIEREKLRAKKDVMLRLLEFYDTVCAVVKGSDADSDVESLRRAVKMIVDEWTRFAEGVGLAEVRPEGEKFDATSHEALATEERDDIEPGTIVGVAEPGYRLGEEMLRTPRVVVARRNEAKKEGGDE